MAVMVTGATGFLGINLLQNLLASGERVVGFSNRALPEAAAQALGDTGHLSMIVGDVRDRAAVEAALRDHAVRRVVHAAVVTSGPAREREEAEQVIGINIGGLSAVAAASARHGIERLVLVGSVAVFSGRLDSSGLLTEETPHNATSLYAISKSTCEAILARIAGLNDLDWVVGRLGTLFGPWERDTGFRDTLSPIHQVTRLALGAGHAHLPRPAPRNWHYSRDAARALARLTLAPELRHHIYHLAPQSVWTLQSWCEALQVRYPGFGFSIGDAAAPTGSETVDLYEPRDSALLSWQRYGSEFGPTASYDRETAFADYMDWIARTGARAGWV